MEVTGFGVTRCSSLPFPRHASCCRSLVKSLSLIPFLGDSSSLGLQ
ncbi:KLC4 isoform 11 [Pan troglodytes]|uniref:Kinesin light chain 4 n=2 Tax=Homininae TaxID=207598 RepID=F8WCA4_HUMAN|nr:KLC4 isoform 11 [Pan troglodytes]